MKNVSEDSYKSQYMEDATDLIYDLEVEESTTAEEPQEESTTTTEAIIRKNKPHKDLVDKRIYDFK